MTLYQTENAKVARPVASRATNENALAVEGEASITSSCSRRSRATTVLAAGVWQQQVENALAVAFAFNTINRLAEAFGVFVPGPQAFEAGARYLLARGYR